MEPTSTISYFEQRMKLLGITPDDNKIGIWQNEEGKNVLKEFPVFSQAINKDKSERGVDILVYSLDRNIVNYKPEGSRWSKDYCLTRLKDPITRKDGGVQKYHIPKGAGTYPFFHPFLIQKFENKEKIDTLFITEGFFKAFKGCMHGLDVVGVSSITHLKEKDTNQLHTDIRRLRDVCQVRRIVWLTDGDCLDITSKDITTGVDLRKRPHSFFSSCEMFKQLLDDWDGDKWFFHIDTDNILSSGLFAPHPDRKLTRDMVKGLDDLLINLPDHTEDIIADAKTVTGTSTYFAKINITIGTRKIFSYFHLVNVNEFYHFHKERRPDLAKAEFVFSGTRYKYDDKDNECKVIIPAAAKLYFRVGDNYYKFIEKVNQHGLIEKAFEKRLKETIKDDHGKSFLTHIPKYEAFCNYPSHVDFQQVIHNNFNVYFPFEHEPEQQEATEEDCKYIIGFLKHIFGDKITSIPQKDGKAISTAYYQLALDYIQLMYQKPTQRLPILCLVSKENETGKSTFGNLLKAIFTNNAVTVGNADLADDFNSFWATKLLIMCDETKIDKQAVVEKVKSLTFAPKIGMNSKGRDKIEIDFFGKFMFFTNNEDNFIYASEEDLRYWVTKVPKIREKNPDLEKLMIDEIPAFLSFLNHRKLVSPRMTRMWFDPNLLKTEALKRVIEQSHSTVKKELTYRLRQMFLDFGVEEIRMTLKDIRDEFFKNKEENYVERVIKDEMKMLPYHKYIIDDSKFDTEGEAIAYAKGLYPGISELEAMAKIKVKFSPQRYGYYRWDYKMDHSTRKQEKIITWVNCSPGRFYTFYKKDFLKDNEITEQNPELAGVDRSTDKIEPAPAVLGPQEDLPF